MLQLLINIHQPRVYLQGAGLVRLGLLDMSKGSVHQVPHTGEFMEQARPTHRPPTPVLHNISTQCQVGMLHPAMEVAIIHQLHVNPISYTSRISLIIQFQELHLLWVDQGLWAGVVHINSLRHIIPNNPGRRHRMLGMEGEEQVGHKIFLVCSSK